MPPDSIALGRDLAVQTAQRVNVTCAGSISGVWWYRTRDDRDPVTIDVWRNNSRAATMTDASTTTGWSFAPLTTPLAVAAGDRLLIGVHHPSGAYAYTLDGFLNRSVSSASGCLVSPASTSSARNGLYDYSTTPKLPTLSYRSSEYWISPEFIPTDPTATTTTTSPTTSTSTTSTSTTTTTAPTTTSTTTTTTPPPTGPTDGDRLYPFTATPPHQIAIGPRWAVQTAQRVNVLCDGTIRGIWWYRTPTTPGTTP